MATFFIIPKFSSAAWIKLNCALTLITVILLVLNYRDKEIRYPATITKVPKLKGFSGCCAFPCLNGLCISTESNDYKCICPSSTYSGKDCENVPLVERLKHYLWQDNWYEKYTTSNGNSPLWKYINKLPFLCKYYNKKIYNLRNYVMEDNFVYSSAEENQLELAAGRSLAATPVDCPTPMGLKGLLQLPNIDDLYNEVLRRKKFQACKKGTNLLFVVYIQHFLTQFEDSRQDNEKPHEYSFNMAHIYGYSSEDRLALRSFKDGKLKARIFKNEEYPPYISDSPPLKKHYAPWFFSKTPKWAIGIPKLGDNPFTFTTATIWLREHNRVCDKLANEHRDWTDDQLYETAKLIITAETIKITLTEYLQHLLQFDLKINYEPDLLQNMNIKYGTILPVELFLIPTWHASIPDELTIDNTTYTLDDLYYGGSNMVFGQGMDSIINAMTTTPAGEFTTNNVGKNEENLIKEIIENGRKIRLQSFNNYRRKFGLKPFKTFHEITENVPLAEQLQNMYFDVDAVELPIGLLAEKKEATVVPPGMTTMAGSWLVHLLLSHPLNSPNLYKPEVFGGAVGLNLIQSATLKKLFCLNLASRCKHVHVDFKIPKELMYKTELNK